MSTTFEAVRDNTLKGLQQWYPESILDRVDRIMVSTNEGAVYVSLNDHENTPDDHVVVANVWRTIAYEVPVTPALTKWVATDGADFLLGQVSLVSLRDGLCEAVFSSRLLVGDDANPIGAAVAATLESANELKDVFVAEFDGLL
jgi:hypothetical protein